MKTQVLYGPAGSLSPLPMGASIDADFCVIGGGIAGLSAAAELATDQRVVLLERESQLTYHSTGRSAALFDEAYGNPVTQALTRASRGFFEAPPAAYTESALLRDRGTLFIAASGQRERLEAQRAELAGSGERGAGHCRGRRGSAR